LKGQGHVQHLPKMHFSGRDMPINAWVCRQSPSTYKLA